MIIKVFPDKEKAKSIFKLAEDREIFVNLSNFEKFPTGKMEYYYEIIKEFANAIMLIEGFKAIGENAHKDLIDILFEKKFITQEQLVLLQDLRIRRNQSSYEGKQINFNYLRNCEQKIKEIISNFKKLFNERL